MSMANETMNLSEKDDTNFFVRVVRYFIPWKGDGAGEGVKMKAAGGISSLDDAERFLELGADRLGTSRVVKLIKAMD